MPQPPTYLTQLHISHARSLLVRALSTGDVDFAVRAAEVTLRRPLSSRADEETRGKEVEEVWKLGVQVLRLLPDGEERCIRFVQRLFALNTPLKEELLLELGQLLANAGRTEDAYDRIEASISLHPFSSNPHLHGLVGTISRDLWLGEVRAGPPRALAARESDFRSSQVWDGAGAHDWAPLSQDPYSRHARASQDPYARLASSSQDPYARIASQPRSSQGWNSEERAFEQRVWKMDDVSFSDTPLTQDEAVRMKSEHISAQRTNFVPLESALARTRRLRCEDHLKRAVELADEKGVASGAWVETLIEVYYLTDRPEDAMTLLEARHARFSHDPLILRLLLRHHEDYPSETPVSSDRLISLSTFLSVVDPLAPSSLSIRLAVRLTKERLPNGPPSSRAAALVEIAHRIAAFLDVCRGGGYEEGTAEWAWRELGEVSGEARSLVEGADSGLWTSREAWWPHYHLTPLLAAQEKLPALVQCALVHAMAFPSAYARMTPVHAAVSAAVASGEIDEVEVELGIERCGVTVAALFGESQGRKKERYWRRKKFRTEFSVGDFRE
ncbi:hypothetical protein M427DRAFT_51607 [Gonapodya prolifera JEL478]|uniref:Uncharacterized protein n=1 Tax=Gonapodya prolifera (strain JEL478) TaxID=1344416 RepID=A0A139AXF1_GONPJ|nr:hypothetical protein M427DRAFT_51607 [Gonapodya prolifera JEL478]|eukprot:KXS21389.1 hypothetical protein M427DRAFT_51607 [Gonapodya prolifera JEL478]